jgi:hypothetical protein
MATVLQVCTTEELLPVVRFSVGKKKLNAKIFIKKYFLFMVDPSDFHLSSPLNNRVGGRRFPVHEEVGTEVGKQLRQQSKNFYDAGFDALVK